MAHIEPVEENLSDPPSHHASQQEVRSQRSHHSQSARNTQSQRSRSPRAHTAGHHVSRRTHHSRRSPLYFPEGLRLPPRPVDVPPPPPSPLSSLDSRSSSPEQFSNNDDIPTSALIVLLPSVGGSHVPHTPDPLKGSTNWPEWRLRIEWFFVEHNVTGYVDGTIECPDSKRDSRSFDNWMQNIRKDVVQLGDGTSSEGTSDSVDLSPHALSHVSQGRCEHPKTPRYGEGCMVAYKFIGQ